MSSAAREAWGFVGTVLLLMLAAIAGAGLLSVPILLWGGWGAALLIVGMFVLIWFGAWADARERRRQ